MTLSEVIGLVFVMALLVFLLSFVIDLSALRWWRRLRGGHWELWHHAVWPNSWWLRMPGGRCSRGSSADALASGSRVRCEDYIREKAS